MIEVEQESQTATVERATSETDCELFPVAQVGDWFVLHTKSRSEKVLADELAAQSISHYLPVRQQIKYYGSRRVRVTEPLYPGYLFLRGTIHHAYAATRTKRVANILKVGDQHQLDWELNNLWTATALGAPLLPYPCLVCGVRVQVRSGPLRGLQGIVENRKGCDRLILQIEMLGRAVSVEVDGGLLDLV